MSNLICTEPSGVVFTGIGSRALPGAMSFDVFRAGFVMAAVMGARLRSGAAPGSDTVFEQGVRSGVAFVREQCEGPGPDDHQYLNIFLPGPFFNGSKADGRSYFNAKLLKKFPEAQDIAKNHHPKWEALTSEFMKSLMTRNTFQVLGTDLTTPPRVILAYTQDGARGRSITQKTGGTGQALRLAHEHEAGVFNLGNAQDYEAIMSWVEKMDKQLSQAYGLNLKQCYSQAADRYAEKRLSAFQGDLSDAIGDSAGTVLVHGCNCFNTMGSGVAKYIASEAPEALRADQQTKRGDRSKLGTYTSADCTMHGKPVTVVNAYTQYRYGSSDMDFDYKAFEKVLDKIDRDFSGQSILFPRIGAGRAGGCWFTAVDSMAYRLKRSQPVVVLSNESPSPKVHKNHQMGMSL